MKTKKGEAPAQKPKKKFTWKSFGLCLLIAQGLCEIFALVEIVLLDMLPFKYLAATNIILAALITVMSIIIFKKSKKSKAKDGIGLGRKILSVILVILICTGSLYAGMFAMKTRKTLNNITNQSDVRAVIGVYVRTEDPAQTINDCAGYTFGAMNTESDYEYTTCAVNEISGVLQAPVVPTGYDTPDDLVGALYSGTLQAIIMNESYATIVEDNEAYIDFESRTRLIYECVITDDVLIANGFAPEGTADAAAVGDITAEPFILYISGSDTRSKILNVSRSDVNILMVVNPQTKQILLINTPRDYFIPNPESSTGAKDKLTHLGIYGVDCSIEGLENLYDCKINYYGQLNFTGFETLINDLGGVTINNPVAFSSKNVPGYSYSEGEITLMGDEALAYARERYAFASGDNMRGQNQMRIITGVINKLTHSSSFLTNYASIMDDMSGMFVTSMTSDEIENLVKMQLGDMAEWNTKSYAVTGTGGSEITYSMKGTKLYVMYPDEASVAKAQELIDKVIAGGILTDEDVA